MSPAMTSPSLYKYLSVEGARLTLGNRCFKHAKPSTFNDTEDLTIRSLFPEDDETALAIIENNFTDVLLKHIDDAPTCLNGGMRAKVALILAAFKANPNAARIIKEAKKEMPSVFNLEHMRQRHLDFVAEVNAFMQGFRILCVSSRKDSERMWDRYAEGHKGIVLKISPNVDKDSKFQRFLPVVYQARRPTLYESAEAFQESGLFGDQLARIRDAMDKIVYAKTLEWEYENEYRLAIPIHSDNDWETLGYHPKELSELYLGANAPDNWKAGIVALAESINPDIAVYEMFYSGNGNLLSRFFH
jgi:Protein of unknown function (DUF2971)